MRPDDAHGIPPVQVTRWALDTWSNIIHPKLYYASGEIFGSSPYQGANQNSDADRPLLSKSNAHLRGGCRPSRFAAEWTIYIQSEEDGESPQRDHRELADTGLSRKVWSQSNLTLIVRSSLS